MLGVPDSAGLRHAADLSRARPSSTTSICSATPSRCCAQADAPYRNDESQIVRAADPLGLRGHGAAGLGGQSAATPPGPTACCATTSIPPPRCRATPRRATPPARRWRRWSGWRAERSAARLRLRMDRARLSAEAGRQHRHAGLRPGGGVRLPAAGRALRERDPAVGGDPDRADVPAGGDDRGQSARAWTTTS